MRLRPRKRDFLIDIRTGLRLMRRHTCPVALFCNRLLVLSPLIATVRGNLINEALDKPCGREILRRTGWKQRQNVTECILNDLFHYKKFHTVFGHPSEN